MGNIKRAFVFLIVLITAVSLCVESYAKFDIDGIQHNDEWNGSELYSIGEDTGFNNDIEFAYVRVLVDDKADVIYICVSMFFERVENLDVSAVTLKINNGSEIRLNPDGSVIADSQKFNICSASSFDKGSKTSVTEASVAVKEGFDGEVELTVCLIDTRGQSSNVFNLIVNRDNDGENVISSVNKSDIVTDSDKTTKQKTTKKTDAFTYKKVNGKAEGSETSQQAAEAGAAAADVSESSDTPFEDITPDAPDRSIQRKKLITAIGVICAVAVVLSALTAEIIKRKKSE